MEESKILRWAIMDEEEGAPEEAAEDAAAEGGKEDRG